MEKLTDVRTDGRKDDGQIAMAIAHLSLWLTCRWAKNNFLLLTIVHGLIMSSD